MLCHQDQEVLQKGDTKLFKLKKNYDFEHFMAFVYDVLIHNCSIMVLFVFVYILFDFK